ncbi:hypothetical protein [Roseovarius sp. M141]|uniref:hypothetical protein n=1 Tax=Roseovarius sp. M141 TaxID=2583806 RepID=UPI0020CCA1DB|nr:hypothetical protein [Roseovarius sp. M141]MCQ0093305.1 hypothetical protein [Roseovarius sp. M141]
MARLLLLICLICVLLALVGLAVSALTRAAQDSKALAQGMIAPDKGVTMERISYTALILLMLGVTSGLLGGL